RFHRGAIAERYLDSNGVSAGFQPERTTIRIQEVVLEHNGRPRRVLAWRQAHRTATAADRNLSIRDAVDLDRQPAVDGFANKPERAAPAIANLENEPRQGDLRRALQRGSRVTEGQLELNAAHRRAPVSRRRRLHRG